MSEFMDAQSKEKKILYTCPCGFCSYDLMEFLKHPFMEDGTEQDKEAPTELKKEEK